MIIVRNKIYDIHTHTIEHLLKAVHRDDVVLVDWCQCDQSTDELIQAYLPVVEALHQLGCQVKVRMPLVKGVQFSQHQPPIVFCGHKYNPFRFDQVDYCFKETTDA